VRKLYPRNIVEKSIRGEDVERIPVIPLIGVHSAYLLNVDCIKAFTDSKLMSRIQVDMVKYYKPDGVFPFMNLTLEAEALGLNIRYVDCYPSLTEKLNNIDEIDKRELNIDVFKGYINVIEEIYSMIGDRFFICSYITGPFTLGYQLFNGLQFFKYMFNSKYSMENVLEKIYGKLSILLEMILRTRADLIMVLEPILIYLSPQRFEKYCFNILSDIFKKISLSNKYSALHICGNNAHLLKSINNLDVNVVQIDSPVDISYARRILPEKCLIGNIDTRLLKNGSPRSIVENVKKCLEKAGETFFILSSGCEVPRTASSRNILSMIRAARGEI